MTIQVDKSFALLAASMAWTLIENDADENGYPNVQDFFQLTTEEVKDFQDKLSFFIQEHSSTGEV